MKPHGQAYIEFFGRIKDILVPLGLLMVVLISMGLRSETRGGIALNDSAQAVHREVVAISTVQQISIPQNSALGAAVSWPG